MRSQKMGSNTCCGAPPGSCEEVNSLPVNRLDGDGFTLSFEVDDSKLPVRCYCCKKCVTV